MVTSSILLAPALRFRSTAAAVLMLGASCGASALTLGRLHGAAWLGQPLNLTVSVQIDERQGPDGLCFAAEVFHGDLQQDATAVRVTTEPGAQPQSATVRIRSTVPVDEPVVTVYLKETCLSKTARRFVMLSEIPPEALTPGTAPEVVAAAPAPATASGAVTDAVRPAEAPRRQLQAQEAGAVAAAAPRVRAAPKPPVPRRAPAAVALRKSDVPAPAPVPAAAASSASPSEPPKSRLKLTLSESLSERVARLEATAVAQAAIPAAPTAQEVQEAQRLLKLEQSLQNLVTLTARNERSMAELREQLRRAEAEKYANPVVYGLAALLLAALGGLAYLWRRLRQMPVAPGWWDGAPGPGRVLAEEAPAPLAAAGAAAFAATALETPAVPPDSEFQMPLTVPEVQETAAPAETEIDLDNLLASPATAGASGRTQAEEEGAVEFPVLGAKIQDAAAEYEPQTESEFRAPNAEPAASEFPVAGEVTIDVSHLSLSLDEPALGAPATEPAAAAVSESLLDFDLPGQPAAPQAGAEADKPGSGSKG